LTKKQQTHTILLFNEEFQILEVFTVDVAGRAGKSEVCSEAGIGRHHIRGRVSGAGIGVGISSSDESCGSAGSRDGKCEGGRGNEPQEKVLEHGGLESKTG
jgi:hypothetical protein